MDSSHPIAGTTPLKTVNIDEDEAAALWADVLAFHHCLVLEHVRSLPGGPVEHALMAAFWEADRPKLGVATKLRHPPEPLLRRLGLAPLDLTTGGTRTNIRVGDRDLTVIEFQRAYITVEVTFHERAHCTLAATLVVEPVPPAEPNR